MNENERKLVCGTDKGEEGWETVPLPQAQFHLQTILENLGYLFPRFERRESELFVWTGEQSKITALEVFNDDRVLEAHKKRKIVGYPLVSAKFSEVDAWANLAFQRSGYACVTFDLQAQAWDGKLLLTVSPGQQQKIASLETDEMDGLHVSILDRYRPFEIGDRYDGSKTRIMTARMLVDGLFQSAYFIQKCREDEVDLRLVTSVGKPKILRFGIGASTEELPFIDLSFRNARLEDRASSLTANLHASPRLSSLTLGSEIYLIPGWNRTFIGPRFRAAWESEASYETNTWKLGSDLGRMWDQWDLRWNFRWGPTLNYSRTLRGAGAPNLRYLSFEGTLLLMSHEYEYTQAEQYSGWTSRFSYRAQRQGLGSPFNLDRYDIDAKYLWNVGNYAPPLFVLGTRVNAASVRTTENDSSGARSLLPIDERIYLGGDRDLRGFGRTSINNDGLGYLTSLYLGFELRLIEELPYRLQPFLLWDAARVGNRVMTLDEDLYTSEGLGMRWASPFGSLRGSAAQGRINGQRTQWVYFVSFGQEF